MSHYLLSYIYLVTKLSFSPFFFPLCQLQIVFKWFSVQAVLWTMIILWASYEFGTLADSQLTF